MIYSGKTDIGKVRSTNQDSFALKSFSGGVLAAVVCDGMGGVRGGNIASETAVSRFLEYLEDGSIINLSDININEADPDKVCSALAHAVYEANNAVYHKSQSDYSYAGMGTTLAACIVIGTKMYAANVGDSRVYIDTGRKLNQISQDHSYVQFLIDVGDITPEEAKNHPYRNRITRAVGIQPDVDCDIFTVDLEKYPGAKILICSDGLCGQLDNDIIHKIICSPLRRPESRRQRLDRITGSLIEKARENGGPDNITAILISVFEDDNA